jgi:hypothetical protein
MQLVGANLLSDLWVCKLMLLPIHCMIIVKSKENNVNFPNIKNV